MTDQHPLSVERFGPVRRLQRERYAPLPPFKPFACDLGPSRYQMTVEATPKPPAERAA